MRCDADSDCAGGFFLRANSELLTGWVRTDKSNALRKRLDHWLYEVVAHLHPLKPYSNLALPTHVNP
jgi:hypothetical protein